MKEFLLAMAIFEKYIPDEKHPFHCDHDILRVTCNPGVVSSEDKDLLGKYGFFVEEDLECFASYKYGSC